MLPFTPAPLLLINRDKGPSLVWTPKLKMGTDPAFVGPAPDFQQTTKTIFNSISLIKMEQEKAVHHCFIALN